MNSDPHFLAQVTFYGSARGGGRDRPPQSGFRPQLEIQEVHTSCTVESAVDGVVTMAFDREHDVKLTLLFPELYVALLKLGDTVRLFEGSKLVGEGTITSVLRSDTP